MPSNKVKTKADGKSATASAVAYDKSITGIGNKEVNSIKEWADQFPQFLKDHLKLLVQEQVNSQTQIYKQDMDALKAEIVELKSSQEFICNQYDQLKKDYDDIIKKNREQKIDFDKKTAEEASKIDCIEQYGRRQNLEFKGVPQKDGENTNDIVVKLAKVLDVDIKESDISTSHRLPAKHKQLNSEEEPAHPVIIARFVNRDVRNAIYGKRKAAKHLPSDKFPVQGMKELFVNENLTQQRKKLLWLTKQRAKVNGFKYVWTNNGKICVRENEESPIHTLLTESELNKVFG